MPTDYTVEIYKMDRRYHKGERLIQKVDVKAESKEKLMQEYRKVTKNDKFRIEIFETWVTKKNLMSGAEFQERYDTPYYCSPSSESYWSN